MTIDFDPVIFSLGPLQVRWYGLMYVIGALITGHLLKKIVRNGYYQIREDRIDTMITVVFICIFVCARLAYVFIYNWDYYSQHLAEIPAIWKGGLSYHGALVGITLGGMLFARMEKVSQFQVWDAIALAGSQGVFWGRLGNFINGELWGRVSDVPWAMHFKNAPGPYARHPSQLYEAVLEGALLWLILWLMMKRVKFYGRIAACYLWGYGTFRFIAEYFRQPDQQVGYLLGGHLTMGQILCLLMILFGGFIFFISKRANEPVPALK